MTTYVSPSGLSIGQADFWRRTLADRMADFAGLREQSAFIPEEIPSNVFGDSTNFYSVIRHAELTEISRKPHLFCSGQGSTSIQDLPMDCLLYTSRCV